jgi:hypothetical protein
MPATKNSSIGVAIVVAVLTSFLWWQHEKEAVQDARAIGRGDTWATICDKHPKLAEALLGYDDTNPSIDIPLHCKDYENQFEKYP